MVRKIIPTDYGTGIPLNEGFGMANDNFKELYGQSQVYGIEYDVTHAAPEVTRVGNMALHASLPVQSKMRKCLLDDKGNVNYYLDPNDGTLRDDGTPALLDGTHGQVMVEVPEHYESFTNPSANINRAMISLQPFENSRRVEKFYIAAYKAALNRTSNKLSSVVNATADYRGGNNSPTNDANAATLLGKPASSISRINFDLYAENRGAKWAQITYEARKKIFWLITIEYATRNHQANFDATLTPEGYRQGALGKGATDISSADWTSFNGQNPALDCGLTNEFGNDSGEKEITLIDFPIVGETRTTQANSYRGIENFFGDIWEWTNGINYRIEGGIATAYISNGKKTSNTDYIGYRSAGSLAGANGYISQVTFGVHGDITPKSSTGGSSTTFFCDYWSLGVSDGLRGLLAGGALSNGARAGSAFSYSYHAPSSTIAYIGSRLCFF